MEHEVYDAFFEAEDNHWWFEGRRRILNSILDQVFPTGGLQIADVGCGTGGMARLLNQYGTVTGVDEAPEAREYCARRGLPVVLTPEEWDQEGKTFDLVTSFDVVEHVEDDVAFLETLKARLSPSGWLLVTVPAYQFMWSVFDEMNHHKRRYTRGRLKQSLAKSGFEVERMSHFNTHLFPGVLIMRMIEKIKPEDPSMTPQQHLEKWFRVGPLNSFFANVFASERHWLRRGDLPFGSSIVALARPKRT